jgi:predicted ester cyclase
MNSIKVMEKAFAAIEKGDFAALEHVLDDEFRLTGTVYKPIGKKELVQLFKALKPAFPDWAFNATGLKEIGDRVIGRLHISGTHSGPLDLSFLGLPPRPATGIKVKQPEEPMSATLLEGKIHRLEIVPVKGGGI